MRLALLEDAQKKLSVHLPRAVLVLEKTQVDAGEVWKGDTAHFVFPVKNTGDAPLELEVKPNCGCTIASFDKVVAPGSQGKIEADFHTGAYRGRTLKTVEVTSNDLDKPHVTLFLASNVLSVVNVLPTDVPVLTLKEDGPSTNSFKVQLRDKDAEISEVNGTLPYVTAKATSTGTTADGRTYDVNVTVGPEAPMGRSAFILSVKTTSPKEPQSNITVLTEKGVMVTPVNLFFGTITPKTVTPMNQVVMLQKHTGDFHIKEVKSEDPHVQVKQDTVKDGSDYRLTVTYIGGWPTGAVRSSITVTTDDPKQSTITIPINAVVSPTGAPAVSATVAAGHV